MYFKPRADTDKSGGYIHPHVSCLLSVVCCLLSVVCPMYVAEKSKSCEEFKGRLSVISVLVVPQTKEPSMQTASEHCILLMRRLPRNVVRLVWQFSRRRWYKCSHCSRLYSTAWWTPRTVPSVPTWPEGNHGRSCLVRLP